MSLKYVLLAGSVFFGAVGIVHSENAGPPPAQTAPADLFEQPTAKTGLPTPPPRAAIATALPADAAPIAAAAPPSTSFVLERPQPPAAAGSADPQSDVVDTGALRYYASQNDLARVAAEIRQLRSHHPDWEPPDDLFSDTRTSVPEQPLWDLYAKHDYDGLTQRIAEITAGKPDWQPSRDLATKLKLGKARDALDAASDAQQWGAVVELATDNRGLLTCADVDSLWRTAEALVHVDDEARAIQAWRYILTTCTRPEDRLATVQKASLLLPTPGALDDLMALGHRRADGHNEFEPVRLDMVRRRIGEAAAAGTEPAGKDVATVSEAFGSGRKPADAELLGWSAYALKRPADAEKWFRAALALKATPKAAEGLALALRDGGKLAEAEDVAYRSRDLDPLNRKLLREIVAAELAAAPPALAGGIAPPTAAGPKPEVLAAFLAAVESDRSADGAQAYGWHLYNAGQIAEAETWFRKALGWQASEPAAVGLMVSAKRLGQTRDYAALVAQFRTVYPKVAELEALMRPRVAARVERRVVAHKGGRAIVRVVQVRRAVASAAAGERGWDASADAIVRVYQGGDYGQALGLLEARRQAKAEPHGLSVIRGWAQYHRGDWDGAQKTFASLDNTSVSREAHDGLRVIDEGYRPKFYH